VLLNKILTANSLWISSTDASNDQRNTTHLCPLTDVKQKFFLSTNTAVLLWYKFKHIYCINIHVDG